MNEGREWSRARPLVPPIKRVGLMISSLFIFFRACPCLSVVEIGLISPWRCWWLLNVVIFGLGENSLTTEGTEGHGKENRVWEG